jgi:hypothetical protein
MRSRKKFDTMEFVARLVALGERQLENETKAAALIEKVLVQNNIPFTNREFQVDIPRITAKLFLDGVRTPAAGVGLVSGTIDSNYTIISSLVSSSVLQETPNISFNPRSKGISRSNHYFAPAIAVDRSVLSRVLKAKKVQATVVANKVNHSARDILVGNTTSPRKIVFSHYDSIESGAIDNASGVAVMLHVILSRPELRANTLFVFSANEELSYDKPVYWGHGFRSFENECKSTLTNTKKIIVIDSVGNGPTNRVTDPGFVKLAFPLSDSRLVQEKVVLLCGDFDNLMRVYHSTLDDGSGLSRRFMNDAVNALEKELEG